MKKSKLSIILEAGTKLVQKIKDGKVETSREHVFHLKPKEGYKRVYNKTTGQEKYIKLSQEELRARRKTGQSSVTQHKKSQSMKASNRLKESLQVPILIVYENSFYRLKTDEVESSDFSKEGILDKLKEMNFTTTEKISKDDLLAKVRRNGFYEIMVDEDAVRVMQNV